ncbi:TIGR04219 family outer membrane beta-barrel protein [Algibacillus agarilyticus]|uniref:TIGR04219 family outer membrane beta-barrel protein n=1 Tax=Algibacillus agarilyticus TaxID=2234133 RepID=UPI000DCFA833|nr:TIGR04219 family outer membrane beta-barrel protein [Algibacillus agarilyticus]
MKITNLIKASILATTMTAGAAQADMIYGLYFGAQGWQTGADGTFGNDGSSNNVTFDFEDKTSTSFYAAVEHPIPLIPNIKVRQNNIEIDGNISGQFTFGGNTYVQSSKTTADLTNTDFIIYYEILDNDLISIDIGLNGKKIDGSIMVHDTSSANSEPSTTEEFSGIVPMAYAAAEIGLPFTGLSIYADGSFVGYDGNSLTDIQAGVQYAFIDNLAVDMSLQLGVRSFALKLNDLDNIDTDIDVNGGYLGLQVHF